MKNNRVIACVVAGALGFALLGGVALAQSSDQSGAQGQQNKGPMGRFMDHLASRLGISTDQLQQAAKDAAKDTVDDGVAAGTIPSDKADKIKQRIDEGKLPFGAGPGFPGLRGRHGDRGMAKRGMADKLSELRGVSIDAAAGALGISSNELTQTLRSGTSLDDLATQKGKDPAAVRSAVRDAVRQHLQAKVDSGTITASQADKIADQVSHMFGREHRAEKPKPSPSPSPTS